jgi:DASS family divalent anion:Na+ symporter
MPRRSSLPRLALCLLLGISVAAFPPPEGLSQDGWHVFAVFTGVVLGFLIQPMDMGPVVLLGTVTLVVTKTIKLDAMVSSGLGDSTVWLVVAAFLIADAVEQTGLGRRLALLLLRWLGRSLTGLAYAISMTELLLAPLIPSNTARGGGILAPIVHGLAQSLGSFPRSTAGLGGAYLIQVGAHANLVTSSMFLTAMAGNVMVRSAGIKELGVDFDYWTWLQGSFLPGLISLLLVPLALRLLERPRAIDMTAVREKVGEDLRALGPWKGEEKRLALILAVLLFFWSLGKPLEALLGLELSATTVALGGVLLVVLLNVRTWRDLAGCWHAWDALMWLGGFVGLAEALKSTGFTAWFAKEVGAQIGGLGGVGSAVALALVYFVSMYLFSQLTAHAAALAGAFLAVSFSRSSPPYLSVAMIAYFTCLCGTLTSWSTGPVIIYFQLDYVSTGRWMRNGLFMAFSHLILWLSIGMAWWKVLGWW